MVSAVNAIAVSGFQAATKRLENSANNVANQNTTDALDGEAFEPKDIVQLSDAAGGVRTEAVTRDPATVSLPSLESESGIVQAPNVDTAEELIAQQTAVYDAKANLAVLRVQDEIDRETLDILA